MNGTPRKYPSHGGRGKNAGRFVDLTGARMTLGEFLNRRIAKYDRAVAKGQNPMAPRKERPKRRTYSLEPEPKSFTYCNFCFASHPGEKTCPSCGGPLGEEQE